MQKNTLNVQQNVNVILSMEGDMENATGGGAFYTHIHTTIKTTISTTGWLVVFFSEYYSRYYHSHFSVPKPQMTQVQVIRLILLEI